MKLFVSYSQQKVFLFDGKTVVREYSASLAANGLSCEDNSFCTPMGRFRISEKIGAGLPPGAVLRARTPSGEIWSPEEGNPLRASNEDLVLSRVLWLEGCDSFNANTKDRYIYLHGTNQEHLLGTPASHGCVRLSNADIIELFDLVEPGTEVEIQA